MKFLLVCMVLSKLITVILYVFTSHLELEVTEWNCIRNSAVLIRDIKSSHRIVDIWNSLPAAVILSPSVTVFKRNLAKLTFSSFTLLLIIIFIHVYYRPTIIACHAFYCEVSSRLVLLLLINWYWLIDWLKKRTNTRVSWAREHGLAAAAETATQSPAAIQPTDHSDWIVESERKQNADALALVS